ncbi:unnamed protein product [Candidula unifasciata]|uniref:DUF885 domain-containing protein n=1 Tax=Candidula unifasciata TaxID=100452 RepID=A0A8S3Z2E8_9EUPU|nr:unnamed protein product [Candidula unifasciata]
MLISNLSAQDSEVLNLCEEIWQWRLSESPEVATYYGFHQFDDLWDDLSEEAYIRREACVQDFLKRAESLDTESCSSEVKLSYNLQVADLKLYLQGAPFRSYLIPVTYSEGIHNICHLIISYMKFDTEEDFHKYISRLERLPARIQHMIPVLRRGIEEGIVAFSGTVDVIPNQIEKMLATSVEDLGLMQPFKVDHPRIPDDKLEEFKIKAKELIISGIFPALGSLKTYFKEEYFNHLRPKESIDTVKGGTGWYQQALNFYLTCPMTPQEVHNIGLQEVSRIRGQIMKLAAEEKLGQTFSEISDSVSQRFQKFFHSKEHVLEYVQDICYRRIRPKLSLCFKNLPPSPMKVSLPPDYLSEMPGGLYLTGTPDGSREGCFYINSYDYEHCLPLQLMALSLHEGEPGHHLQGVYALASTHLPNFRRYIGDMKYHIAPARFGCNTAYAEGWGLYAESLGEELNLYEDSIELLGRYKFEIFRAARLVVDTGIHAFGWSKEEAIQYLTENTLSAASSISKEVDRYITLPGQACAYKIGEIKIWELRRKSEKELGEKFDIKEFHHRILSCGAVPVSVLEMLVDQYIAETKLAE